jgi:hypothetical protein
MPQNDAVRSLTTRTEQSIRFVPAASARPKLQSGGVGEVMINYLNSVMWEAATLRPSASSARPRRIARPSDDLSEGFRRIRSGAGGISCAMCTQQGVARMSHQPSFDCAQPSSELPADAQGPYAKLASEAPLPARPNLQVNGPQLIP